MHPAVARERRRNRGAAGQEDDSFGNSLDQHERRARGIGGRNLLQRTVKVPRIRSFNESKERSRPMKGELPMERQAVQVKINDGEWQPAVYQDGQFVDLYGLPLDYRKITTWRPSGAATSGHAPAQRDLRSAHRPV